MNIDVDKYYGLISPRPTVCISTVDSDGNSNLAPYSFLTPLSFNPPLIVIGVGEGKDTIVNARDIGDFVVTPLTEDWMVEGIKTGESLPHGESEFDLAGLNTKSSEKIKSPSVAEAAVNIECEYYGEYEIGDHLLLVGEVVNITANEDAVKNDRIALEKYGAVGHISGEEFAVARDITEIERN
ncbi:NADH-FMN oxidoreductase RutF of DIM6/NTAB family [Methanonatronarchaeum thermophilum]|uniref:NADH-FMN oxidoreductase RutF of DIM6/NTAB family n=1 Tax=Methanonatronarchaeum thermophilum TaxID=1927129 RepID=A0A1Y3GC33_9EURY|nr:NADH-FMN oxidoreductase RutF of DIM6/NTAB family [Methanonatronarchaeum thermophilum]